MAVTVHTRGAVPAQRYDDRPVLRVVRDPRDDWVREPALLVSTPWTKDGEFYALFQRNHGDVKDALAAHAPTSLMRPDERTRRMLERERVRDADNASREFDAVWLDVGSSGLFAADLRAGTARPALVKILAPSAEASHLMKVHPGSGCFPPLGSPLPSAVSRV